MNLTSKKKQIYAVTTDNGRNILKAVDMLSESVTDEDCIDGETNLNNISEDLCREHNIRSIKCAAHTLQLAIKDFFVANKINLVNRVRQVAKTLRNPSYRHSMQQLELKKPILDVPTRWNSTFLMMQSLLDFKNFCSLYVVEGLTEAEWDEVAELVAVMTPLNTASLKLQEEQMCLGDFYKLWLKLTVEMRANQSDSGTKIYEALNIRQTQLLDNPTVNAALFLDPRLRRLLSIPKKEEAKTHLRSIASNMVSLKTPTIPPVSSSAPEPTLSEVLNIEETSSSSLLRQQILDLEVDCSSSDDESDNRTEELQKAFAEIDSYKEKRLDIDEDLLKYWEDKKFSSPYLSQLAAIVHSTPATQVSVERAFSALKLILSDHRYNLSTDHLKKILFVKLNT